MENVNLVLDQIPMPSYGDFSSDVREISIPLIIVAYVNGEDRFVHYRLIDGNLVETSF